MKQPSSRIAKHRRNPFATDFNTQEDDLLLADIKILQDEDELDIAPLEHVREAEDDIDRLLVNTGFDAIPMDTPNDSDAFAVIEDIGPDDEKANFVINETHPLKSNANNAPQTETATDFHVDGFISTYLAMRPAPQLNEPETTRLAAEPVTTDSSAPDLQLSAAVEKAYDHDNAASLAGDHPASGPLDYNALATDEPHQLAVEQKNAGNPRQRHQARNMTLYVVLVIAITTLISTLTLAMMVYNMKTEIEKLTGLLAIVKEDMEINNANQNLDAEESKASKLLK